jgi:hypothetical protein
MAELDLKRIAAEFAEPMAGATSPEKVRRRIRTPAAEAGRAQDLRQAGQMSR